MVARKPTSPSPYTQATLEKLNAGQADSADVIRLAVQCWAEWESRDRPCSKLVADIFDAVMRILTAFRAGNPSLQSVGKYLDNRDGKACDAFTSQNDDLKIPRKIKRDAAAAILRALENRPP